MSLYRIPARFTVETAVESPVVPAVAVDAQGATSPRGDVKIRFTQEEIEMK
jgi:hypothetical protein